MTLTSLETHSLVIPIFNEEATLPLLFARLEPLVTKFKNQNMALEVVLVNDGSRDKSREILNQGAQTYPWIKVLHFSRNFGHQVAITAGLEWATGQTVTVMDGDLQDPPELIEDFLRKWREGFEVVFAVREKRQGETWFKLTTAKVFYRLIRKLTHIEIPVDTGDFRLMDRRAVKAFLSLGERHRFVRGMVSWVGFKQTGVFYKRDSRRHGETHYPLNKMFKFALDGITSFSAIPLQLATYLGFISAAVAFLVGIWVLYSHFFTKQTVQGWSSLVMVVLFLGGAQLVALGVMGEYLGRIYDETKGRPLYIVDEVLGFSRRIDRDNAEQPKQGIHP